MQCNSMLVYVYPQCLRNTILSSRMFVMLVQLYCAIQWPKCAPRDNYGPRLPGLCGPYLMKEHNHKRFKSLPRSLCITCDFSNALKIFQLDMHGVPNGY